MLKNHVKGWAFVAITVYIGSTCASDADVLQYVNQLIGSINEDNVFAGATLSYGNAKAAADVKVKTLVASLGREQCHRFLNHA